MLTHPGAANLIAKGTHRSIIPGSLSAVDRTIEETVMKFAKGSGMSDCILITIGFFHLRISVRDKKYDVVMLTKNTMLSFCLAKSHHQSKIIYLHIQTDILQVKNN